MKRILCLALAAFFGMSSFAAAEIHGVYFAPKFLVGIQSTGEFSKSNLYGVSFDRYSQVVFGGALAVGYNFAPKFNVPIRTEIEYALRSDSSHRKDGSGWASSYSTKYLSNISTLFLNAYFDLDTGTPFTPYVGGGLGMSFNYTGASGNMLALSNIPGLLHWGRVSGEDRSTNFAWNVGAGVAYSITENIAADLGYRFISAGYREVSGAGMKLGNNPYINEFYTGLRFSF